MGWIPAVNREAWQPHGDAMLAYHRGQHDALIGVCDDYGDSEEHLVSHFFRDEARFPPLERRALGECRGRVLDVGAGTGCHALALQDRGFQVTALEVLPILVEIMTQRGVRDARLGALGEWRDEAFDTVVLLMNGLGLAGTLTGLEPMLRHLAAMVAPDGQVIADATDPRILYGAVAREGTDRRADGRYLGELTFQFEFAGERGPPFPQLYVDPDRLGVAARRTGWVMDVLGRAAPAGYLVRLIRG